MGDWKDWSSWLQEGYYISFLRENIRYYEHIIARDLAHYEYSWPETITAGATSGPYVPADLEITKGYNKATNVNNIWQMIFGILGQAYVYVELPTDIHRHGIPKQPKPSTALRETSHFEEWMSPFREPSFLTEHFLIRPENYNIAFSTYNPGAISLPSVRLNIFIAKLQLERVGTEQAGVLSPTSGRWADALGKLYRRVIPHRPLTLMPVRLPAEAPAGE